MLSVRVRGDRPGSNRRCGIHNPGCFRLHHGHHESGDDRTRTGGLSPDKRALCSSELRPQWSRGWDSNPRSRAHEAREDSRSSTAQVWLAGVEPAISGFRSRRGGQSPLQPVETPGGSRTRSFRVEGPASFPFDHGGKGSGGRARTCLSRLTVARLTDSTTPERKQRRQQDSNLRTARTVYAVATRCLASSTMPPQRRKEGESNPQGCETHPFSRRDTAPVAVLP